MEGYACQIEVCAFSFGASSGRVKFKFYGVQYSYWVGATF